MQYNENNLCNVGNDDVEDFLEEIEKDQKKSYNETFDFLKEMGVNYLNNNASGIGLVHEAFIHFLIHEEYEKCAYLKMMLNEFRDYRLLKSTNLMNSILNELDKF